MFTTALARSGLTLTGRGQQDSSSHSPPPEGGSFVWTLTAWPPCIQAVLGLKCLLSQTPMTQAQMPSPIRSQLESLL